MKDGRQQRGIELKDIALVWLGLRSRILDDRAHRLRISSSTTWKLTCVFVIYEMDYTRF